VRRSAANRTLAANPPLEETAVRAALAEVPDPEIPVASVVDLGMVEDVAVGRDAIRVELLPTFVGCPALDMIQAAVEERLSAFGHPVDVRFSHRIPWTSDRITREGREKLRAAGFAPPGLTPADVACPWCGSDQVAMDNLFGPTQCRSLFYCRACRQPFEAFKQV
jgi:ring-1,2-phenylacetyl-CoA epoxidase subunit PaaD